MRLRRLIVVEITLLVVALVMVITFVELAPFLKSSKEKSSVGLYQEREYASGNVTMASGERSSVRFVYSSYDPAILVVNITFLTWESPGYVVLRCNYRVFGSVFARPENPSASFAVVSFSGREWVQPPSSMFGINEISFESESEEGYGGMFSYRISVRGSR